VKLRPMLLVRVASVLVIVALVIELASLFWSHPLSFIVFAMVGGAALGAGLLIYLYWLIFGHPAADAPPPSLDKE
jgi:hypothetical protein